MRPDVKPRPAPKKDAATVAVATLPEPPAIALLRKTLIALVILLTFEGLLRKLEPGAIGAAILLSQFLFDFYDWNKTQSCASTGGRHCGGAPIPLNR